MASPSATIPPLNKIFIIGIWIETVLWGINNVVFAGVLYVLFCRPNSRNTRWILGGTSLLLYLCATLHVSAAFRQELEAFIFVPPGAPAEYASLYFAQEALNMASMKNSLYTTVVFIQDLVLIWRMYVVWGRSWKIILLPLTVELIHMGCAYAAVIIISQPNANIYSPALSTLGSLGWPLELVVNICVTSAIASRLWYMGHKIAKASSTGTITIASKRNAYAAPIFTIVESGAILIAVTITMLVLYKTGNPAALMVTDIATQIAALVPYLIIVRVGLGLTHGLPSAYKSYLETIRFGTRTENSMHFASNHLVSRTVLPNSQVNISKTVIDASQEGDYELSEFKVASQPSQEEFAGR